MPSVIVLNDLRQQTDIVNPLFLRIFILATRFFRINPALLLNLNSVASCQKFLKKIHLLMHTTTKKIPFIYGKLKIPYSTCEKQIIH